MKYIYAFFIASALLTMFGCNDSKDETQFEGIDNHVTSFVLTTVEGAVYEAAITGGRIEVTVPENCSLEGARAACTVCEQAVLYPDPAAIGDWDNEHRFRVVSKGGSQRDYLYTVRRTGVASGGSVVLLAQSDVEAFAASGVSVVEGSLVIGSLSAVADDPITDLSPLSHLTEVRYDICINSSFKGESLDGLGGVVRAGGLVIGSQSAAVSLENGLSVDMPSLESLGALHINCADVTALQFPRLRSLGSLYADAAGLAMADLSKVENCDGYFIMKAGTTSSSSNTMLTSLDLSSLRVVRGMFSIEKYAKMQSLALPKLELADGTISLTSLTALEEVSMPVLQSCGGVACKTLSAAARYSFPELVTVSGDLSVEGNTSVSPIEEITLPKLRSTAGRICFQTAVTESLERLELPELMSVGGDMELRYMRNVAEIVTPRLTAVGGKLYLYYMSGIAHLDISGIADLRRLDVIGCSDLALITAGEELNDVAFNGASTLTHQVNLPAFENPVKIKGTLDIGSYRATAVSEMELANVVEAGTLKAGFSGSSGAYLTLRFPDLERVGTFTCTSAYWLKGLELPKLAEVTVKMEMNYMQYVPDGGISIPELRKINELVFNGSTMASTAKNFTLRTSLADFADVEQIGKLTVKWWGAITDFSGLSKAAASVPDGNWDISGNVLNGSTSGFNPTKQDILDGNSIYHQ